MVLPLRSLFAAPELQAGEYLAADRGVAWRPRVAPASICTTRWVAVCSEKVAALLVLPGINKGLASVALQQHAGRKKKMKKKLATAAGVSRSWPLQCLPEAEAEGPSDLVGGTSCGLFSLANSRCTNCTRKCGDAPRP